MNDPSSGLPYWLNVSTGEAHWIHPAWEEARDGAGQVSWVNHVTGETARERPPLEDAARDARDGEEYGEGLGMRGIDDDDDDDDDDGLNGVGAGDGDGDGHADCYRDLPEETPEEAAVAENVERCQAVLWRQLHQHSHLGHLAPEEAQITMRLRSAFERRVSTSILVVGPTGCGKRELVEKVMLNYAAGDEGGRGMSVARVNGLVHMNDNQAITSLADQFLLRPATLDRNVNIAHEDLENHFKQCRFNLQPAVIIIEEIQEFLRREKQV